MVGTGAQVLAGRRCNLLGGSVRDDRVDQPVRPTVGDVLRRKAVAEQVASVIAQSEVQRGVAPRLRSGRSRSSSSTHASSGARSAGSRGSRAARVCSTGTKYVCAPSERSALSSSIFGPSAARHRLVRGTGGARGVESVEEGLHRGQRLAVLAGGLRMADADAEQHASREMRSSSAKSRATRRARWPRR